MDLKLFVKELEEIQEGKLEKKPLMIFYRVMTVPTLTYGYESWATKEETSGLQQPR